MHNWHPPRSYVFCIAFHLSAFVSNLNKFRNIYDHNCHWTNDIQYESPISQPSANYKISKSLHIYHKRKSRLLKLNTQYDCRHLIRDRTRVLVQNFRDHSTGSISWTIHFSRQRDLIIAGFSLNIMHEMDLKPIGVSRTRYYRSYVEFLFQLNRRYISKNVRFMKKINER